MIQTFRALALLGLVSFGFSCGKDEAKYTYDITVNQCATGKHEFSNKEDYCRGLTSDSLNHGCAEASREDRYVADCGAPFVRTD